MSVSNILEISLKFNSLKLCNFDNPTLVIPSNLLIVSFFYSCKF